MKPTTPTILALAVAAAITLALPSCSSTAPDPFDLALSQSIARMAGDIGMKSQKEEAQ